MTDVSKTPREPPVSPHLLTGGLFSRPLWRWHITMWTSILHRVTGIVLYVGVLIAAAWAISLAAGPEAYAAFKAAMGSILGLVVMFGLTLSLFYHLANGVRHLVWDSGKGFEPKTADMTGWAAIAFGVGAAVLIWIIAFLGMGAGQ